MIEERDFVSFLTVKRGLSERSIRTYRIKFRVFLDFLRANNLALSKGATEQFFFRLKEKGLKPNTLNSYIGFISQLRDYSKDRGLESSYFEGYRSFKAEKKEVEILSLSEIQRLASGRLPERDRIGVSRSLLEETHHVLTNFLIYTGCRISEATNLLWEDVDFSTGTAHFRHTKNRREHKVFLKEPLFGMLYSFAKRDHKGYVFKNQRGKKIVDWHYGAYLKQLAASVGILKPVHPHMLRHSFATHLYNSTHDIAAVATEINHKNIQTTYETYVHIADETRQKVLNQHVYLEPFIDPEIIIRQIEEELEKNPITKDKRFDYVKVKDAVHEFTKKLHTCLL